MFLVTSQSPLGGKYRGMTHAISLGLLDIQPGGLKGRTTMTLATHLLIGMHKHKGHLALLDVERPSHQCSE